MIIQSGSTALSAKLVSLEDEKVKLQIAQSDISKQLTKYKIDPKKISSTFYKAKQLLKTGALCSKKEIVEQYIDRIILYKDRIDIKFNIASDFIMNKICHRD